MTDWDPLRGTDWDPLLRDELEEQHWAELEMFIKDEYSRPGVHPLRGHIFAALHLTPHSKTKVVIVGQDPYPDAGMANGLAFAVPSSVKVLPGTLANIYQELHDDLSLPIPDNGNLEQWARRGVLLLNATLTFRAGDAALHRRKWKAFTNAVILVADKTDPVFILWGKVAQNKVLSLIDAPQRTVISSHPSDQAAYTGFFGSKPFSQANQALLDSGREGIDWSLA